MKVLYVTNMYPSVETPHYGVFVKEQIKSMESFESVEFKVYYIKGYKGKLEYLKSIFLVNSLIKKWKPDIIHIHHGLSGLFLLFNPTIAKRSIITLHGGDIQIEQGHYFSVFLTKRIIKKAFFVIALNNIMLDLVKKINPNVKILKCGVDLDTFKIYQYKKNSGKKTIIFPGDPNRKVKNFKLFQRTFDILKKKTSDWNLQFIPMKNLDRKEVNILLNKADCLLMTSISEGSPQVVKEAMACNLPIVSVNVGDVKVLLNNVSNCYVANSFSEVELADLVYKVLKSSTRHTTGRNKIISLGLDNATIAKQLFKIYDDVVKFNSL